MTFFSQWKHALRPTVEARRLELRRDLGGLAKLNLQIVCCRYGMEAQAKAASNATWDAKQRGLEGHADSMVRMQETGRLGGDMVCGAQAGWPQEERVPLSCAHARR